MRKYILLLLVFLSFNALSQNHLLLDSSLYKAFLPEGLSNLNKSFHSFKAMDIRGKTHSTSNLINKITFINFWFEDCAPCRAEFRMLSDLYDKYKSNKNFQFLAFTFETAEKALQIADKYNVNYPVICIPKEEIYKLNFNLGFPTNIITDKSGIVKYIKCGGMIEETKVKAEFELLYYRKIEELLLLN